MFGERERRQLKWIIEELKCHKIDIEANTPIEHSFIEIILDDNRFEEIFDPLKRVVKEINYSSPFELNGDLLPIFKIKMGGIIHAYSFNKKKPGGVYGRNGYRVEEEELFLITKFVEEVEECVRCIEISGNKFLYFPTFGSDGSSFKKGDIAKDGWINSNTFVIALIYKGEGDPRLLQNWKTLQTVKTNN